MPGVPVQVHRLDPDLPLPAYAHPGDAGIDLFARVDVLLAPGQRALVPTGIAIALPEGYAAFGHPRSGLATRHGITILNAPGTIDAGYRGEIFVNLVNLVHVNDQRGNANLTCKQDVLTGLRRSNRPVGRPTRRSGAVGGGRFAPGQPPGGHWTRSQWRLRGLTPPPQAERPLPNRTG